jgi:iron complex transport system substrate-binding protein
MKHSKLLLIISVGLLAALFVIGQITRRSDSSNNSSVARRKSTGRIVCTAANLTEILFALGLEDKIAGVSNESDYPPAAAGKRKVGTFWQPDTESIIACRPDLVIMLWFQQQRTVAESLRRLGYEVLTLRIETIGELYNAIQKISEATNCSQQGEKLVETIRENLQEIKDRVKTVSKVRVLWVVQAEPLRVAGRDTFINELIELAGGENAIGATLQQYPPIGTEELLGCNAEVIIKSSMGRADIRAQQRQADMFWSKYKSLPAVKNKRIYVVDSDTVLRLGPRLPEGAGTIAGCLHPELFEKN